MDFSSPTELVSDFEFFLFNTQQVWYYLLLALLAVRVIINYIIYNKIDSPLVAEPRSDFAEFGDMIPQTPEEQERFKAQNPYKQNPRTYSQGDSEFYEFILVCIFTLWWGSDLGDTPKSLKLKKGANVLNVIFIPLAVAVIIMFFKLQMVNHHLENATRSFFYFLR